jgi:hypothetical protein
MSWNKGPTGVLILWAVWHLYQISTYGTAMAPSIT